MLESDLDPSKDGVGIPIELLSKVNIQVKFQVQLVFFPMSDIFTEWENILQFREFTYLELIEFREDLFLREISSREINERDSRWN